MCNRIASIKQELDAAITQLCEAAWMFSKNPGKDFSRNRKLPFRKMISLLLSMEGATLKTELLDSFGCSAEAASSSAFVQQRKKINQEAFPSLFRMFVRKADASRTYKGLRLIAADGSDIQIPANPNHPESFFPGTNGQSPYSLIHLDAMYDLLQRTYMDATLLGQRKTNERSALCAMVDRSEFENVLLIADRGYEGFNLMAHIQEKAWKYLIRIQDIVSSRGIASGLDLPDEKEFDMFVDLSLTARQTKEVKLLCQSRNQYRFIPATAPFDSPPQQPQARSCRFL